MSVLDRSLALLALVMGVTVHEFAHAWASSLLGDDFARRQGRVSLNPLRHLTPLGTLAVLLLPFGWGRPVPVNLYNYRHPRRDYLLSSLAGPAANLGLVAGGLLLMHLTRRTFLFGEAGVVPMLVAHDALHWIVLVSAMLAVLNLLPIPPLDGSKIWPCLLPGRAASYGSRGSLVFVAILGVLLYNGWLNPILEAAVGRVAALVPPSHWQMQESEGGGSAGDRRGSSVRRKPHSGACRGIGGAASQALVGRGRVVSPGTKRLATATRTG